ncbi:hypothetical protein [uncultured Jannaschia sp.]|uniref:hypothetical protein n=1 Tax=uncultured Jannaschia sp. TaxID=293347 RepID=UPI00262CDC45|nr:hypothetical protein [uncultured Jannaschia sp.]
MKNFLLGAGICLAMSAANVLFANENQVHLEEVVHGIRDAVIRGDLEAAISGMQDIPIGADLSEPYFEDLHNSVLAWVSPLPISRLDENAAGYMILSLIRPSNESYKEKAARYGMLAAEAKTPSIAFFRDSLSANRTSVQRDAFWDSVDGEPVAFRGRITNVEEAGFILPAMISMEVGGQNARVRCGLADDADVELIDLSVGDSIICGGRLFDYGSLFGFSLSLNESYVLQ